MYRRSGPLGPLGSSSSQHRRAPEAKVRERDRWVCKGFTQCTEVSSSLLFAAFCNDKLWALLVPERASAVFSRAQCNRLPSAWGLTCSHRRFNDTKGHSGGPEGAGGPCSCIQGEEVGGVFLRSRNTGFAILDHWDFGTRTGIRIIEKITFILASI